VVVVGTSAGVQRTTDGGQNWTSVSGSGQGQIPAGSVNDIVAGTGGNLYASIPGKGVFKSTDAGATWTAVNNGPLATAGAKSARIRLAVHNDANGEVVYAGVANAVLDANGKPKADEAFLDAVYRSSTGGSQWTSMQHPFTFENGKQLGIHTINQALIHFSLVADPNDANAVYVGGDTNDSAPKGIRGRVQVHALPDRIATLPVELGHGFVHHDDRWCTQPVSVGERPSLLDGNTHGLEVVWPHHLPVRRRPASGIRRSVAFDGDSPIAAN